jgi:predicted TPR repeat methyltransferase
MTPNREAAAATLRQVADAAESMTARRAALVASVALETTGTVRTARRVIEAHPLDDDVRALALAHLDDLEAQTTQPKGSYA